MFLKDSKPATKKQNVWFGAYCTACIAITAALLGCDWWIGRNISETVTELDVRHVSVIVLNCSKYHFYGHYIHYRDDNLAPGLHIGRACYDWNVGAWELTQDIDWQ